MSEYLLLNQIFIQSLDYACRRIELDLEDEMKDKEHHEDQGAK